MTDLESLLAPISEEQPAGPDLEYDAEFIALDTAARGKPEQQFGDTVIAAEEPNWRDLESQSEALLTRSKDLRVAVINARAVMRMHNIEGLSAGLQLITGLVSRYWDTLHPGLDHEDNDDPTMRLNALGSLADSETFLRDVRNMVLVASPQHGRVAIRDILVASGKLPPGGEKVLTDLEIGAITRAIAAENPAPLQAALKCVQSATELEAFLNEKGVLTQAPDLRPLMELLQAAASVSAPALHVEEVTAEGATATGEAGAPRAPGQISSREDVVRVLDDVCRYIEQAEPSNPAPLFIRRAQRLMSRSFVEIIEDLAPDSMGEIQKLAGLKDASS